MCFVPAIFSHNHRMAKQAKMQKKSDTILGYGLISTCLPPDLFLYWLNRLQVHLIALLCYTRLETYLSWCWDSTRKHRNFCPHKSVVINTFVAWEFFALLNTIKYNALPSDDKIIYSCTLMRTSLFETCYLVFVIVSVQRWSMQSSGTMGSVSAERKSLEVLLGEWEVPNLFGDGV